MKSWDKFSEKTVVTASEILNQPIWLNKYINLDIEHYNISKYIRRGLIYIKDIWDLREGPKWESAKVKAVFQETEHFIWRSIISAIPSHWKKTLNKSKNSYTSSLHTH